MAKKYKRYEPKEFESAKHGKAEPFSSVYLSMFQSEAWRGLTAKQRDLYYHCKLQLHADSKSFPKEERLRGCFTFNRYKWLTEYGLYTEANQRGFYRDMDNLILRGFVDCIRQGQRTKEKNLYRMSDRWQHFGLDSYDVPAKYMTSSLYRKHFPAMGKCTQDKHESCGKRYIRRKATERGLMWKSTSQFERCVRRIV